ncbi:hypothetical protein [Nitrosospira sp. Nsp2]|uniref:hypothetical protein n=1 Tax=Nitrosospira sp. Nsp2 TaxID=136548 RepID=UPI0011B25153|nr:hypothetical protein [Nitrosospira sp. Nsp2]
MNICASYAVTRPIHYLEWSRRIPDFIATRSTVTHFTATAGQSAQGIEGKNQKYPSVTSPRFPAIRKRGSYPEALFGTEQKPGPLIHKIIVGFSGLTFQYQQERKPVETSRGKTSHPTLSHLLWSYL